MRLFLQGFLEQGDYNKKKIIVKNYSVDVTSIYKNQRMYKQWQYQSLRNRIPCVFIFFVTSLNLLATFSFDTLLIMSVRNISENLKFNIGS